MFKSKNLLSVAKDAKTVKGVNQGVLTGILYLAPHTVSGYQVCPKASVECAAACLYKAGQGVYNSVQTGRINKTLWFFRERDTFMARLVENIISLEKKAKKESLIPAVRLNGTSDIAWEKIAVVRDGKVYKNVMEAFPHIQFYDYTKVLGRKYALSLPNYHLTFSLSENNDAEAVKALEQGYNVAVVLNIGKNDAKPETWGGFPVINGDETDIRFRDPKGGHIVALTAKGPARKLVAGGFVRSVSDGFRTKEISIKIAA